ncbi:serine hydrolase [Bacillus sp. ISL-47]|uniref:serine hydrolase n=1 Tax=Bacillus sp. ISL-47 TaxID=2819130 RepID=UPI001BE5D95C|nr:serine hydrolase [Bacillus sp. ISL-47]MBT2687694.1 serine hydrolase [Bacillus sp. ISL-47]MBT2707431.1 serine hydrolase [Pseudomonas sp. ISL-84]
MGFLELKAEILELASRCEGRVGLFIQTEEGIIEENGSEVFSSASLIKVPILLAGLSQAKNSLLQLDEEVQINDADRVGGSGVLQSMSKGLKMKVIDLMTLMIIVSDNAATNLVIDLIGEEEINGYMKSIELKNTELNRKMMDFEALKRGLDNKTTAIDMVSCLKTLTERSLLPEKNKALAKRILDGQQFKNKLANTVDPAKVQVAGKTGELPGIEHDCAIFTGNRKIVYAAVLVDELKNQTAGREVLSSIGNRIYRYMMKD